MSLLLFALVVLAITGLACYLLREFVPDARVANVGSVVLLIVAIVVIAQRAGVGLG